MAGEPVGEVDSEPLTSEPAIGQRCASSVRIRAQEGRAGRRERGHPRICPGRKQGAAPLLGAGLEQSDDEHVEWPEANAKPVELLAIGLLERADGAHQSAARQDPAGVGAQCRQRPDSGRGRAVGRSRSELLERLQVTVDNGIASVAGVERAHELGMKVLVTDHHLPGEQLPAAEVIVNPNQPGCRFPSKCIAGVGVMFYLLTALRALSAYVEEQPQ